MATVVVAKDFGGPEALSVIEEEVGQPGAGEVLIDVKAAGVNPIDHKLYSSGPGNDPSKLPMRLGFEAAGVVRAVGPDATGVTGPVTVGDEVIAYRVSGAYASALVAPASSIIAKPAQLDWPAAAGLMLAGVTAWHTLVATGVGEGDVVLVHNGAGGVGVMAVQLGVARGARVIATAGRHHHDLIRELGGEPIEYGPGLADLVRALAPGGVDAALDLIGTDEAIDTSLELVTDRNRIATINGFAHGAEVGIQRLGGAPGADPGTEIRAGARPELARMAGDGQLRVVVSRTFPLQEAAAAHTELRNGHTTGKVALVV